MLSIVFFIVAVTCFYISFLQFRNIRKWLARALMGNGEIIRIESGIPGQEISGPRKNINVFPVFKFSDRKGRTLEAKSRTAILRSKVKTGDILDILYDPDSPDDVRIGSGTDLSLSLFLVALGIVFLFLALAQVYF